MVIGYDGVGQGLFAERNNDVVFFNDEELACNGDILEAFTKIAKTKETLIQSDFRAHSYTCEISEQDFKQLKGYRERLDTWYTNETT